MTRSAPPPCPHQSRSLMAWAACRAWIPASAGRGFSKVEPASSPEMLDGQEQRAVVGREAGPQPRRRSGPGRTGGSARGRSPWCRRPRGRRRCGRRRRAVGGDPDAALAVEGAVVGQDSQPLSLTWHGDTCAPGSMPGLPATRKISHRPSVAAWVAVPAPGGISITCPCSVRARGLAGSPACGAAGVVGQHHVDAAGRPDWPRRPPAGPWASRRPGPRRGALDQHLGLVVEAVGLGQRPLAVHQRQPCSLPSSANWRRRACRRPQVAVGGAVVGFHARAVTNL